MTQIDGKIGMARENFMSYPYDSLTSLNYTFQFDKYSCVRGMWFFHIFCAYAVSLSGLGCFVTRAVPRLKPYHVIFGRAYVIAMLWCTASAMLIHNTGLPLGVLISFVYVLGGMTIAWIFINIHQSILLKKAMSSVEAKIQNGEFKGNLHDLVNQEKGRIAAARPTWEKIISWKGMHGLIMFTSWINITGRIFASDVSGNFQCLTYPVYKPVNSLEHQGLGKNLTLVPVRNPDYDKLPWGNSETRWGLMLLLGPLGFAALFGYGFAHFTAPRPVKKVSESIDVIVESAPNK
jgi:hypothetical protein